MLRLPNNVRILSFFLVLLCAMTSCGFIDLRQIGYSVEPNQSDALLSDSYSPVIIRFETEMEKNETEKIVQISSDIGVMKGDLLWNGNDLYFIPVPGWTAGVRYTLSLLGTIRSVDGRELRVQRFVSFYAINKSEPPLLEYCCPADGASIGTGGVVLEFHFSGSMDRLSTESAVTVEGIGNKNFEWLGDDKILKVIADKSLAPWTSFRWSIKETAKSVDGVPLPKSYSGYFTTDLDQTLPQITGVFPVLYSDGSWYPTGAKIESGLGSGQGIAIQFNKPMGENVLRSVRFEPALTGRTEFLDEKSVVYIFTKDPEPETTYTMIISADTRDSEGLKTGTEYRVNFVPDIPFLTVLSFFADGTTEAENIYSIKNELPVLVDQVTGDLFFSIRFSLLFDHEEKLNAAQKIMLTPFFPRTLSPVALVDAYWYSEDRLFMRWEGLKAGGSEVPHYYKLTIPGGRGGISAESGKYMKEDITIYLEAVNEK